MVVDEARHIKRWVPKLENTTHLWTRFVTRGASSGDPHNYASENPRERPICPGDECRVIVSSKPGEQLA